MKYNWQQPDWPNFRYDLNRLEDLLYAFAGKAGHVGGLVEGLPDASKEEAVIDLMVSEAVKTSQIEGEAVLRSDVKSSIRNNLGLNPTHEKVHDQKAEGVGKLLVEVRKTFPEPLDDATLFKWHRMLMAASSKKMAVGRWREHEQPMQIVSGAHGKQRVHFEAPSSSAVPKEMARFIQWFNETGPAGKKAIKSPPLRSAMSHLYFETIHPFEDGNGRIGRAIAEKVLSQGLNHPVVMSLSKAIEADRKGYYSALQQGQQSNEITDWVEYFVKTIIVAQDDAARTVSFVLFKTRLFDRYGSKMNERQRKAVTRMLESGPDGFAGGMRTQKYMSITGASKATTARDLQGLVELGVFTQLGDGRSTHYQIAAREQLGVDQSGV